MTEPTLIIEDGVVAGNVFDKYGTANPIARAMMNGFLRSLRELVQQTGARAAHEVGCGEGHLCALLNDLGLDVRGSDFSPRVIDIASANVSNERTRFSVKSIYELRAPDDAAELIVCCEVLEHLEDPARALAVLAHLARPYLIVSVPCEPLWRLLNVMRGKYLRDLGNTPGHLNHWSSADFIQLLRRFFQVEQIRRPLPWTMVLCRRRAGSGDVEASP